ncbi:MAG: 23S rRNA (guanosine(2251)-2'-O)-methyltransferase RlmB [Desulfobulbaceae bacterium]|nr:23S rRNA (guanosine(2251)-2'-O)-methyltransferase RlmB [Desulfobulbaceae bacterium]
MSARTPRRLTGKPKSATDTESTESDLIWGVNTVFEALRENRRSLSEILVQRGKAGGKLQEIIDLARSGGVRLRFVEPNRLGVPRGCRHQSVVARQTAAYFVTLDELLEHLTSQAAGSPSRLLVLDSIQDPRNLGSILRSALAAGFDHVILTRERSAPVTGTVARTSAGAVSHLQLTQVVNLADTLKELKEKGFWIFGAVPDRTAVSLYDADFFGSVCIVIGSEGKGIRPLVKKQCDQQITIPMHSEFDSLNASVAAGIIMFEVARRQLAG